MLGVAATLASCSQDDLGGARTDGAVTITATVDGGMGTRASSYETDDVATDRCLLEVYDADGNIVGQQLTGAPGGTEGTFTFTVSGLDPDARYDFLFWADNKEAAAYGGSLKARKLNAGADLGEALAFQGKIEDATPENATQVTLTHAVAKVTLKTTGAMEAGDKVTLSIPNVADTWDVSAGTATGDATGGYAYTLTSSIAKPQDAAEVATFYVPAPVLGATSDVTLAYADAAGTKQGSTDVTNVPLQANYRTVLKGDVAALYEGATASVTAQLEANWSDQSGDVEFTKTNTITTSSVGQITEEAVREALEIGEGTVIIKGQINEADLNTIAAIKDVEMNLDLSQATLMNSDGTAAVTTFPSAFSIGLAGGEQSKLVSIILPQGIETLSNQCFNNNKSLTSVTLPEGLKTIGTAAFAQTGLTSIDFPEGIEEIGDRAFQYVTTLTNVTIPESVTAVGEDCFGNSGVKNVVWNSNCDITEGVFERDAYGDRILSSVTLNKCGEIAKGAFTNATIQEMTVNLSTPPAFEKSTRQNINAIYVPAASVDTYKTTADWSEYSDVITAIQ